MSQSNLLLQATLRTILSVFLFFYPWGVAFIAFGLLPLHLAWLGSIFLIVMGTLSGLWLVINYGRLGLVVAAIIFSSSWLIEHIGVTTGFPFGVYEYTDVLVPKIMGVVPMAMSFAWLLVVPASIGVTNRLLEKGQPSPPPLTREPPGRKVFSIGMAASLATLLDIVIEPAVGHVPITNYWIWMDENGVYYDVPLSNFVAWWLVSLVFVLLLRWLHCYTMQRDSRPESPQQRQFIYPWLPPLLYLLLLTQFVLVNLTHNYIAAVVLGGPVMIYLTVDFLMPYLVRRRTRQARGQ